ADDLLADAVDTHDGELQRDVPVVAGAAARDGDACRLVRSELPAVGGGHHDGGTVRAGHEEHTAVPGGVGLQLLAVDADADRFRGPADGEGVDAQVPAQGDGVGVVRAESDGGHCYFLT